MTDSYFEDKIAREKAIAELEFERIETEVAARQAAETNEKRLVSELQRVRDKEHFGIRPEEVWGERDAMLCADFIAYMGARRKEGRLPGSITIDNSANRFVDRNEYEQPTGLLATLGLRKPKLLNVIYDIPEWSTSAYPIAFTDPLQSAFNRGINTKVASALRSSGLLEPPHIDEDVVLCEDGLLRSIKSANSLRVLNSKGDVDVPIPGHFNYSISNEHAGYEVTGAGTPAFSQIDLYTTTFHSLFVEDDLEVVLMRIIEAVD